MGLFCPYLYPGYCIPRKSGLGGSQGCWSSWLRAGARLAHDKDSRVGWVGLPRWEKPEEDPRRLSHVAGVEDGGGAGIPMWLSRTALEPPATCGNFIIEMWQV